MELSKNFKGDLVEYTYLNRLSNKKITKFDELIPGHAYGWDVDTLIIMRDKSKQKTIKTQKVFFVLNKTDKWVFISYLQFYTNLETIKIAKGEYDYFSDEPMFGRYHFQSPNFLTKDEFTNLINIENETNDNVKKMKNNFFAGKKGNIGYVKTVLDKYPQYDFLQYPESKGLYEYDLDLSILDKFFERYDICNVFTNIYKKDLVYPVKTGGLFDDPDLITFSSACLNHK